MIDLSKPVFAKVYDFDPAYPADDEIMTDERGEYVIRQVVRISLPHLPYQKYPTISCSCEDSEHFELLEQN